MQRVLPAPKEVRDLLEDLLGRPIEVAPTDPVRSSDLINTLVGLYVDDTLRLAAVIGMDYPLTVYTAAAIGLIPVRAAQEVIAERSITPMLAENAAEVCNVLASLLNREGLPHVRMYQAYLPGQSPPTDATGYLLALGRRLDLSTAVSGYGSGKLSISLAW